LEGIYSPNNYSSRCCRWAHQTVQWCTGQKKVKNNVRANTSDRCGLERLIVEVLCPLAALDSPVRSDFAVMTSNFCFVHYLLFIAVGRWVQLTVAPLTQRTVRCTPDSPVNYSGVTLRKPESGQFARCLGLGTGQCPVRHWLDQYLFLLQTL
jgi:hypothetical protein